MKPTHSQENRHFGRSLFNSSRDSYRFSSLLKSIVREDEYGDLDRKEFGLYDCDALLDAVVALDSTLEYCGIEHLTEVYLNRDPEGIFRFEYQKNLFGYRFADITTPPKFLYFGTNEAVIHSVLNFGLRSQTKDFVRLFDDASIALSYSKRFSQREDDVDLRVIKISAEEASNDGSSFVRSRRPGEYFVDRVSKKYLQREEIPE